MKEDNSLHASCSQTYTPPTELEQLWCYQKSEPIRTVVPRNSPGKEEVKEKYGSVNNFQGFVKNFSELRGGRPLSPSASGTPTRKSF